MRIVFSFLLVWAGTSALAQPVTDLLPDMIIDPGFLSDYEIRSDIKPGKTHIAFSNATANIGDGPIHIFGVKPKEKHEHEELTQAVKQRIFRSDGSHFNRKAGAFLYHPSHNHTHFEGWAMYRLREVLPGEGVGEIVGTSKKTSFCLVDSFQYDPNLPNSPNDPVYAVCDDRAQGISVGYEDVYDKSIPGQWIDITGLPDGEYWLESDVDPDDNVLEKDETNNIARVKVLIEHDDEPGPEPNPSGIFEVIQQLIDGLLEFIRSLFGAR
ncbi:MAG: lysyl oxidase family protein [Candidatus Hydrogenedentes bacterium]|nr:lysyl oxidase family protein [Candidatus Hydrogenedentota bacterium]